MRRPAATRPSGRSKLPPIFVKESSHTAGNSPGANDTGGAVVLASDEWAQRNGKRALATPRVSAESHYECIDGA